MNEILHRPLRLDGPSTPWIPRGRRVPFVGTCAACLLAASPLALKAAGDGDGFQPIFDGKTFAGWHAADMSFWTIEDGALTARITKEHPLPANLYLIWQGGELADFELKLKHRVSGSPRINCGFQFRSRELPNHDLMGYQVDNNLDTPWLVRLYEEHGRHTLAWRGESTVIDEGGAFTKEQIDGAQGPAGFKLEDWHEYDLLCVGPRLTLKVNGQPVAEVTDRDPLSFAAQGILAMQLHTGPPTTAQFKDLRLRIIKPAAAPAAGRPATADWSSRLTDKTLVVWAAPANLAQHGGSALTIDDHQSHFDGIVFAERAPARWMAGSDYHRRTEPKQDAWPAETADAKTTVQIAIVYRGKEVAVYRDGVEYARHAIQQPQSFGLDSFVLIGPRHVGNGDHFAGSIDDARIYACALTAGQIAALRPNEPSEPKPWAWWTFDDAACADRTGRYAAARLSGGAKVEDGRLVLDGKQAAFTSRQRP